jgi:hypothetical protein
MGINVRSVANIGVLRPPCADPTGLAWLILDPFVDGTPASGAAELCDSGCLIRGPRSSGGREPVGDVGAAQRECLDGEPRQGVGAAAWAR